MLLSLLVFACSESKTNTEISEEFNILDEIEAQLSGRFTSEAQAQTNTSYYAVQLHACPVDVPTLGEYVLYIEQAMVSDVSSPYRQRFYVLTQEGEEQVRSEIYTLDNPSSFVGLCNQDEVSTFDASVATPKEGCHVNLIWDGTGFSGSTEEEACPSDRNGATYVTSIVTTTPDRIESWDQGWDNNGAQVWGAIDGAYIFDRKE